MNYIKRLVAIPFFLLPTLSFANDIDLVKYHSDGVVLIHAHAQQKTGDLVTDFLNGYSEKLDKSVLGTGFIIDGSGLIVTNEHVATAEKYLTVTLKNGDVYEASIVGTDHKTDIALLKIESNKPLTVLKFADSDKVKVGEDVVAIGNPYGFDHTVTRGIVSGLHRKTQGVYNDFIQTDAPINPGNSGGPLFNEQGEVIGINSEIYSKSGGSHGIGFAIPSNEAKSIIPKLEKDHKVIRPVLGVKTTDLDTGLSEAMGLSHGRTGVLVVDVVIYTNGLKKDDLIEKFDGKDLKDGDDLLNLVATKAPNDKVEVVVIRNGAEVKLTATLGTLDDKPE